MFLLQGFEKCARTFVFYLFSDNVIYAAFHHISITNKFSSLLSKRKKIFGDTYDIVQMNRRIHRMKDL